MAPRTSITAPSAMTLTSGARVMRKRMRPSSNTAELSSAVMSVEPQWDILGIQRASRAKRRVLGPRKRHGEAIDGLVCLTTWRGRHKTGNGEAGTLSKTSQIGFAVTPAALGSKFESVAVRFLHGEEDVTI